MTAPDQPNGPDRLSGPDQQPERTSEQVTWGRLERRRERIRAEIRRDRAGDHKIPTWVLAAVLGLVVAGWIYLIATR
jgi:hypothetical protein